MKKTLSILLLILASAHFAFGQKYACVNTEYVTANVPDFQQAEKRIAKYIEEWQKELDAKFTELDNLKKAYQQEAYLLPEGLKKRRQDDIKTKEEEVRTLQRQRFGTGGDLDKKREELTRPVQDRIYSAIERIAHEKGYAFVFDKSASSTVIFVNSKYDISDQVLEILGYKPQDNANDADQQSGPSLGKGGGRSKATNSEMNKKY
ncbi:MAG: OmpH family outer membrane protein [Bacteroidales bacterium]|nr:OmpH family outer membrane protein [Bacteroidales bacterium]